jgi:hypothetical protein
LIEVPGVSSIFYYSTTGIAIDRKDPDYDEIGFKPIKDPADEISSQDRVNRRRNIPGQNNALTDLLFFWVMNWRH